MEPRTHAIAVGGGPAGLLAAIHLGGRVGLEVSVLEARGRLGGRASSEPVGAAELGAGLELRGRTRCTSAGRRGGSSTRSGSTRPDGGRRSPSGASGSAKGPSVAARPAPGRSPASCAGRPGCAGRDEGALDLVLGRLPRPRRTFAGGLETRHYLSVHSRPGQSPVHLSLAAYLTPDDATAGTREALETVADRVQPGWRDELVAEPRHLARMRALTAIPTAVAGGLAGRLGPTLPDAPGLVLAGDWVGSEGLLMDAAPASARAAVGTVLGERRAVAA